MEHSAHLKQIIKQLRSGVLRVSTQMKLIISRHAQSVQLVIFVPKLLLKHSLVLLAHIELPLEELTYSLVQNALQAMLADYQPRQVQPAKIVRMDITALLVLNHPTSSLALMEPGVME